MNQNEACFPLTTERGEDGRPNKVLNQITKVRLADGREVGIVDWSWRPIFSTIDTLSAWSDEELRAFTYAKGDTVEASTNVTVDTTATLKHTNIDTPAEMPSTEEFLVYSICVECYELVESTENSTILPTEAGQPAARPSNVALLHESCIVSLEVSQKDYQQASLGWFAAGFGVSGFGSDDANDRLYATNGQPSREAVDMFPVPVHIGATEDYALLLQNPDAGAITYRTQDGSADTDLIMRLRLNLHGLHKRPSG